MNISCSNEVILAAGAIFSPTLLQVSGIGPQSVLASLNVPVKLDLPGVGANFQDHGMLHPVYSCKSKSKSAWETTPRHERCVLTSCGSYE
jgi:choline dehydrogenase-like flavoprotein